MKAKLEKYWIFIYTLIALPLGNYLTFLSARVNYVSENSVPFYLLSSVMSAVFMIAIPLFIIKFHLKKPFGAYGFKIPENKKESISIVVFAIIISSILLYVLSRTFEFQNYYRLKGALNIWFLIEVVISFFYFFSEEFFFRGFFLFKVLEDFGEKYSLVLTNLVFALLHIGKPGPEVIFSFFYGLLLGLISMRTKSFLPSAIIHFFIALILNLLIIFL